jgi:hypothetical protein
MELLLAVRVHKLLRLNRAGQNGFTGVMQNKNKLPASVSDFVQLAQHAFAQARANLEQARVLTEMGETYLERARLAERSVSEMPNRQFQ